MQRKQVSRWWWWVMVGVWICIIFNFSLQPQDQSAHQSSRMLEIVEPLLEKAETLLGRELIPDTMLHWMVRKAAHVTLYLVMGVLMVIAIRQSGIHPKKAIWIGLGCVILVAGLDEFLQTFIPGRSGAWDDVLLDSLSGVVGMGISMGSEFLFGKWKMKLGSNE